MTTFDVPTVNYRSGSSMMPPTNSQRSYAANYVPWSTGTRPLGYISD